MAIIGDTSPDVDLCGNVQHRTLTINTVVPSSATDALEQFGVDGRACLVAEDHEGPVVVTDVTRHERIYDGAAPVTIEVTPR
jgi:hypothetical protein